MRFDIITIFPNIFDSYFNESILKRAREKKLVDIHVHNLRGFATDKRKTVDGKPYGGGAGMVLMAEPILRAAAKIKKTRKYKIVILSAKGKPFIQKLAHDWAKKLDQIIFISGRYEGIDERVRKILNAEEISIGPYVLTGGELPAMIIVDAVSRHIPGVLGKIESLEERRHGAGVPAYTRPDVLKWRGKKYRVPTIMRSGDHEKIEEWRRRHRK